MANGPPKAPKTWSLLGDVRRRPSAYEVTAARSSTTTSAGNPRRSRSIRGMPLNRWYLANREGSPFKVTDWEGFRDPAKLTYADYVDAPARPRDLPRPADRHARGGRFDDAPRRRLGGHLRALFVPLRFPLHVLQMPGLYVGQMAPSSFIINAANFRRRRRDAAYAADRVLDEGAG